MITEKSMIDYFVASLELGRLSSVDFDKDESFYKVPFDNIVENVLEECVVNDLLVELKEKDSKAFKEGKPVPVIVSLRTLTNGSNQKMHGLLLLSAYMTQDGVLDFDLQTHDSWIPLDRLRMSGGRELDIMVGDLKAFRFFQAKESAVIKSKISSWQDYVAYSLKQFETIYSHKNEAASLEEYECSIDSDSCYLKYNDDFDATDLIIGLYKELKTKKELPKLFKSMVNYNHICQQADGVIDQTAIQNMMNSCGHVSSEFPLAPSQRKAVHGFLQLEEGQVLAVSGPPGTGKTTTLQDMVANLVVRNALLKKPAPIIVGTSINNQAVTNIIDSFDGITPESPGVLNHRWLPYIKITYNEKGKETGRCFEGFLPGLATYCPSNGRLREAKQKGYLFDFSKRNPEGVYSQYSSKEYCAEALPLLKKSASEFFEFDLSDLDKIKKELQDRLHAVDSTRRDLLHKYSSLCHLAHEDEGRPNQSEGVAVLREDYKVRYSHLQTRLKFWMDLRAKNPIKLKLFKESQRNLISAYKEPNEEIIEGCASIEEILHAYSSELERLDYAIKAADQHINKQEEAAKIQKRRFTECNILIEKLERLCRLNEKQSGELVDALEKGKIDLRKLDLLLDTAVRTVEFWLATHIYECDWLHACMKGEIIEEGNRFKSTKDILNTYWKQAPCITPCFVMTAYMLPRMFKRYSKDGIPKYDLERIDLLIVDEAGQVDVPIGLASFGVAKQAVVVGDTKQLDPIWSFDEQSDEDVASTCSLNKEDWQRLNDIGATASSDSSLMKLAAAVCPWRYSQNDGGLFLSEHYRCSPEIIDYCNQLLYQGRLDPQRKPARDDPKNPVKDLLPPLAYRIVSDSSSATFGTSRRNVNEARDMIFWISDNFALIRDAYPEDIDDSKLIGIVTPFNAQAKLISKTLREFCPDLSNKITIGTAHKLQGAERSVILFSTVYGNNDERSNFIESNPKLMNVAVSRSKESFIVFCSFKRLNESGKVLDTFFRRAEELEKHPDVILNEGNENQLSGIHGARPQPELSGEKSYAITALLREWEKDGVFQGLLKPTPAKANVVLSELGLISKLDSGDWEPTEEGSALGIIQTVTEDGRRYCRYSEASTAALLPQFLNGLSND